MCIEFINCKWFKNIKFLVLSLIAIGASLSCALHDFSSDFRHYANIVVHPIGWSGVLFFGYALIFMIYQNARYALQGRGMVALTWLCSFGFTGTFVISYVYTCKNGA